VKFLISLIHHVSLLQAAFGLLIWQKIKQTIHAINYIILKFRQMF